MTVGVTALVVVLGLMNGLQNDLREKILVANPHLRVLTYGEGLRLDVTALGPLVTCGTYISRQ